MRNDPFRALRGLRVTWLHEERAQAAERRFPGFAARRDREFAAAELVGGAVFYRLHVDVRVATRPLLFVSLASAAVAVLLGIASPLAEGTPFAVQGLAQAHFVLAIFGFLLPGATAMHLDALRRILDRDVPATAVRGLAIAWASAIELAFALAFTGGVLRIFLLAIGASAVLAAAGMTTALLLKRLPKRKESVADVVRDPLTKGDDASFAQARFAHFLLAPAVVMTVLGAPWWGWTGTWAPRVWLAGLHLLLAGYALVSTYSITHLWVPRLSKVPAIAAGAIKGELHSSLLGLVLLMAGFLADSKGLAIAGGSFLFLGCFTWMGVLGANIMRNKSKTQRVTLEFTYIPWVFTGVFWLVCGVLLGVFLNAVPDALADRFVGLRSTHAHAILLGGMAQVAIGLAMRIVPAGRGVPPVPFHRGKWGFYALNLGLSLLVAARLAQAPAEWLAPAGGLLVGCGGAVAFMTLIPHGRKAEG